MDSLLKLVLNPPPISTTVHHPNFEAGKLQKLNGIKRNLKNKFGEIETSLGILAPELKLFSHILYKNHNRFRNDKGYKDLRMLEKSLKKFINHNFMKSLVNFLGFIPDSSSSTSTKVYLPTYAMGVHAQLQLYGAGALLHRVEMLSKNSALLDVQRLNLGHFWGVAAQNLAVVGRVWVLCRNLLMGVQFCYQNMSLLLAELETDNSCVEMPDDLFPFMPEDLVLMLKETPVAERNVERNIGFNEDNITVDSFLDIGEPVKRESKRSPSTNVDSKKRPIKDTEYNLATLNKKRKNEVSMKDSVTVDDFLDIGDPVKRQVKCSLDYNQDKQLSKDRGLEATALNKKRKMKVPTESKNSDQTTTKDVLSEIHGFEQLKDFLKSESESRRVSRKSSFSHKLSQESWKLLKKDVLSNFNATKPNKSLKLCRKLIRNAVK